MDELQQLIVHKLGGCIVSFGPKSKSDLEKDFFSYLDASDAVNIRFTKLFHILEDLVDCKYAEIVNKDPMEYKIFDYTTCTNIDRNKRSLGCRFDIIKSMNTLIKCLNNEDAYYEWIEVVPDEATNDDFMDIAFDIELFADCVDLYKKLHKKYIEDGIFDGHNCY